MPRLLNYQVSTRERMFRSMRQYQVFHIEKYLLSLMVVCGGIRIFVQVNKFSNYISVLNLLLCAAFKYG